METQNNRQELINALKHNKNSLLLGLLGIVVVLLPLIGIVHRASSSENQVVSPLAAQYKSIKPTPTPKLSPSPTASPSATPTPTDAYPGDYGGVPTDTPEPSTMPLQQQNSDFPTPMPLDVTGLVGDNGDGGYTMAENRVPLGTKVKVTNINTGAFTYATVTSRGDFEGLATVANVSPAVKDALSCTSSCVVRITQ